MPDYRVSVLTTVYNGMPWLAEAIDSVLLQREGNFQYVLVDDGSTDGTSAYLKSLSDSRIDCLFLSHQGRGRALNAGLQQCCAPLVVILDADDLMSPIRLSWQLAVMDAHPDLDVLSSECAYHLSDVTQKQTTDNDFLDIPPVSLIRRARLFHSGIIMRRSALQAVNGYDETRKNLLDADLWIRLAKQGSRLGLMSPRLFYRRIHAGQHFERKKRLSYLWAGFQVRWRAVQLFSQSPLDAFWPCLALLYGLLPVNLRNYLYSWWFMR